MRVLFTLGVYQEDRPERWAAKHSVFFALANSLTKLGHEIFFYCNKKSVKSRFVTSKYKYYFEGEDIFSEILLKNNIQCVVVWGGRTDADYKLRRSCPENIKLIYAEAGWFPQAGTCYFSEFGTNANAQFLKEGLQDHHFNAASFARARRKVLGASIGYFRCLKLPNFYDVKKFDSTKPIFLPLQDEGDTNIVLSSPVKSMALFISKFAEQYPQVSFIARPHPRASYSSLPAHDNVTYQSSAVDPYTDFDHYGGVIGINSTMLLQYALLGLPVAGVGKGVATGSGAYFDLEYDQLPRQLDDIVYDVHSSAKFFDYMLRNKQLAVRKLMNTRYVSKSYLMGMFK